tara:strand:- start:6400 stop:6690 length:291 start_codon:yes stop_codon:yes gene_type:complete
MKKLTTLLGLLFCASIVLTSCGGNADPEADAKKYVDCMCDAAENMDQDAIVKCTEMSAEHMKKYKDNEDDMKTYTEAGMEAIKDCDVMGDMMQDLF